MPFANSVIDLIGKTPLIRLKRASEATGCKILGKAEFFNPGQSVKDRAALWIVRAAERDGSLQPGGTIVEGTAGNTGIGLTLVAKALGYRSVIVIPDTQSEEKKLALRLGGARADRGPRRPLQEPEQLRESLRAAWPSSLRKTVKGGAIWANQFDNVANRQAHFESTGPEIWEATGRQDRRLRLRGRHRRHARRRRHVPERAGTRRSRSGSPTCPAQRSTITMRTATLKAEGSSITEGIGQGRSHRQPRRTSRSTWPGRFPTRNRSQQVFDLVETKGW